jgi:hypothetical protein
VILGTDDGLIHYRQRFFVKNLAPGFVRSDSSTWTIASPLVSAPASHNSSFYAQDNQPAQKPAPAQS